MLPAIVRMPCHCHVDKWPPLRPLWLADQMHPRLGGQTVALLRITGNARADDILPCRLPSAIPGHHMVEVQVRPLKNLPAILARVFVPLEDIVSRKLDLLLRQPLKDQQDNDSRNPDAEGYRPYHVRLRAGLRDVPPAPVIMCGEVASILRRYHLGMPLIEKGECAAYRAGIHRLPQAIEHKDWLIEYRFHILWSSRSVRLAVELRESLPFPFRNCQFA